MCSGGDDFVPRNRTGVKESLHRRLAKTPASLMWPFLVVAPDPFIKIGLQGLDRRVELLAERDTVALVEDGLVKALPPRDKARTPNARDCRNIPCRGRSTHGRASPPFRRRKAGRDRSRDRPL